ncbi:putative heavy metal efflux system protein [Burkholderiales bacterium]|nr:putative heavy metal efflux system protein [Burkholderiales bacterium]
MELPLKRPDWKRARPALLLVVLACAAGAVAIGARGKWLTPRTQQGPSVEELAAIEQGYVCPMHPEITADHPDKCPICGMDLVKSAHQHRHDLQVEPGALSSLGVRLVPVERKQIAQELRSYGTVVADEQAQFNVTSKFDGWLRKVYVHSVGEHVERGQVLYEIYSPELVAKEREYFQFLTRRKQILQSVGDVSQQENEYVMDLLRELQKEREDLLRRDLDIETIQQLEQNGITIEVVKVRAPRSGVVTQLGAREGSFVSPAAPILTITDPSTMWIDVTLAAGQYALVRPGDPAAVWAGGAEPLEAKIDFLNPLLDTGRAHARIVLQRPQADLPLGTLVDVAIRASAHTARVLPSSAVVRTGHGDFVMLARGAGRFVPVAVHTGVESDDMIEIRGGIQEGAQVASNAQFLLDPAASWSDTLARREGGNSTMVSAADFMQ